MKTLPIALLFLAASPAAADNARVKACFDLNSNAEQRDCAHALYRDASRDLDSIVRRKLDEADASDKAPPQFGTVPQTQASTTPSPRARKHGKPIATRSAGA